MPGQTLTEIRSLLTEAGLAPQHRFGQNFLIDHNLLGKLVDAASVTEADVVLEVGPGTGTLTEVLLERGARVIASEIDRGLAKLLRNRLGDQPRFTLVEGDALAAKSAVNPELLDALQRAAPHPGGARKLVANLPYQIATPLMLELLVGQPPLAGQYVTIQREVADRLEADAGTEAYGPLAIVVQTVARVRQIAQLPPNAFWPAPKVTSAMVAVEPRDTADRPVQEIGSFSALVRRCFQQRRKMLRRIVRDFEQPQRVADALSAAGLPDDVRPERLTPADFQRWHACLHASAEPHAPATD